MKSTPLISQSLSGLENSITLGVLHQGEQAQKGIVIVTKKGVLFFPEDPSKQQYIQLLSDSVFDSREAREFLVASVLSSSFYLSTSQKRHSFRQIDKLMEYSVQIAKNTQNFQYPHEFFDTFQSRNNPFRGAGLLQLSAPPLADQQQQQQQQKQKQKQQQSFVSPINKDKNTNTTSTAGPRAQENYMAASFLEEEALNSLCKEAIPLWEEAIQKMGEARKDYEHVRNSGVALDEKEEDALNRALAKLAWYDAQRADCVARVAQDRAMDAARFTKDQVDRWEEAIQEATKAKEAWFKAEQVYQQFLQKADKIVKEWWSQEYHAVITEKENATRDLNWCKDRKEALILAAREKPSEEEIKKFKATDVLECWTEKTLHPGQKKRVSILKTDLNFSLIRREEVFDLGSKVVLSKQEMVANYLLLTLKEGANSELICGRLGLDADSIQKPTSIYSSFYRLCLKEPFLKSWADVMEKIDRDKKLPVEQQQFAMIETVEPDSFWSLHSSEKASVSSDHLRPELKVALFHESQWNFKREGGGIDVERAWNIRAEAKPVIVAVIDSGIHFEHPDFQQKDGSPKNIWSDKKLTEGQYGWNAFHNKRRPSDDEGHGTHVAGIIGASKNSDASIAGIVKIIQLMPCKGLNNNGVEEIHRYSYGVQSTITECVEFALQNRAKILNLSLGSSKGIPGLLDALKKIENKKIIVVAAAANNGEKIDESHPDYPASWAKEHNLKNVVIVAATSNKTKNTKDGLYFRSNYGEKTVHLAAPGDSILSTWNGKQDNNMKYHSTSFRCMSGTSQAVPHVTAALALMMGEFPYLSPQELINRLRITMETNAELENKLIWGGRLNLARALGHLETIPSSKLQLQEWIERLQQEANTADYWVQEVAQETWKVCDEKLWNKAISRISYAKKAWQKVGEACERAITNHRNQSEGSGVDEPLSELPRNEWQKKLEEAQENVNCWEARKPLYKAQQAKIILYDAKEKSMHFWKEFDEARNKWNEMMEIYHQKEVQACDQFKERWKEKLKKLNRITPQWKEIEKQLLPCN